MRGSSKASLLLLLLGACAREPASSVPASSAEASGAAPGGSASAAAAGVVRYLALGDSFTIGTGSPEEASFPSRLAARLRARGAAVTLSNLGVNGYRTEELLAREAPQIGSFKPTLVTLAIGANDLVNGSSPEHYRAQVKLIFKEIDAAGVPHGRVIVLPQPDWSKSVVADSFGDRAKIHTMIESFNSILHEETQGFGARWVELWPLMVKQAEQGLVAGDGLHPSAPAYEAWAAAIEEALPADTMGARSGP
jgi:lysophospholipase L1-like esterase